MNLSTLQRSTPVEDVPILSVITLNALVASKAVNDFLFMVTRLFYEEVKPEHLLISPRGHITEKIQIESDLACSMCSIEQSSLYGRDQGRLPSCE